MSFSFFVHVLVSLSLNTSLLRRRTAETRLTMADPVATATYRPPGSYKISTIINQAENSTGIPWSIMVSPKALGTTLPSPTRLPPPWSPSRQPQPQLLALQQLK